MVVVVVGWEEGTLVGLRTGEGGEKKKGRRKIHRPHVLRFYESKEIGLGSGREPL